MELSRSKVIAAGVGIAVLAGGVSVAVMQQVNDREGFAFSPLAQGSSSEVVDPDPEEVEPLFGQEEGDEPEIEGEVSGSERGTTVGGVVQSIDEGQARARAQELFGGGEVVRIRSDREDGRLEWELRVRDGQGRDVEVSFDAETGLLTEFEVADRDRPQGEQRASEDEARAASAAMLGGEVLDIGPDSDDGRPEWELLVRDEHGRLLEVTVDAVEGLVVEIDLED